MPKFRLAALGALVLLVTACGQAVTDLDPEPGQRRAAFGASCCDSPGVNCGDEYCECTESCNTATGLCAPSAYRTGGWCNLPDSLSSTAGHCYGGAICNFGCWNGTAWVAYSAAACNDGKACTTDARCSTNITTGDGQCKYTNACNFPPDVCHSLPGYCAGDGSCAYTTVSDGTNCGTGLHCSSGSCISSCYIAPMVYPAGTVNPGNPCQSCQPGVNPTNWSNLPGTACGAGQACNGSSCIAGCGISGTFFSSGAANPGNPCQSCQPATSNVAWTAVSDGTTAGCPAGNACHGGACATGCYIGGTWYDSGATTAAGCKACVPALSTSGWTNASLGAGCTDDGNSCTNDTCDNAGACTHPSRGEGSTCGGTNICHLGTCGGGCVIGGSWYATGTTTSGGCQSCSPASSTGSWTNAAQNAACTDDGNGCTDDKCDAAGACNHPAKADGTGCASGRVCAAGSCSDACVIGGTVYAAGAKDPGNSCRACDPARDTGAWSDAAVGATCQDDGNPCTADTCDGTATCTHAAKGDGTGCGSGLICHSATCQAGCWIGAAFQSTGDPNPANACQLCTPSSSTSAWTDATVGAGCDDDFNPCTWDRCAAGGVCGHTAKAEGAACSLSPPGYCRTTGPTPVCTVGCYIAGIVYASGDVDPVNTCRLCSPTSNPTSFVNAPASTACTDDGNGCTNDACDGGGTCTHPNKPNDTSCGVNGEKCTGGACGCGTAVTETSCSDGADNDCNAAVDCADAACAAQACNDHDACTAGETCTGLGTCAAGVAKVCDIAPGECYQAVGTCDPATGNCSYPVLAADTACGDDGDPCTSDACDAFGTCRHAPIPGCTPPPKAKDQSIFGCSSAPGAGAAALLAVAFVFARPRRRRAAALVVAAAVALPGAGRAAAAKQANAPARAAKGTPTPPPTPAPTAASPAPAPPAPAPVARPAKSGKVKIAILALKAGPGVDEKTAAFVTEALGAAIQDRPGVQVLTPSDIQAALGFEMQRQMMGCGESSCMAEIGGALGVDKLVAGSLGKLGSAVAVNLQLVVARNAAVERRYSARLKSGAEDAFLDDLPNWVEALFPSAPMTGDDLPPPAALRTARPAAPAPAPAAEPPPEARWSATVRGQVEPSASGGAFALLGGYQPAVWVRLGAGALFTVGGRAGMVASVAFIPFNARGRVRPVLSLEGMSVFMSSPVQAYGASAGVEFALSPRVLLGLSVPAYLFANAPPGFRSGYVFGSSSATLRF